jgi:HJR/Mrr/RecB family endonuclease
MIRTLRAQRASGTSLTALRAMTPAAFEEWVGTRFRERGSTVKGTGAQGDHGIDLLLEKADETAVVQVKKFGFRCR